MMEKIILYLIFIKKKIFFNFILFNYPPKLTNLVLVKLELIT